MPGHVAQAYHQRIRPQQGRVGQHVIRRGRDPVRRGSRREPLREVQRRARLQVALTRGEESWTNKLDLNYVESVSKAGFTFLRSYIVRRTLGQGSFGRVLQVYDQHTGEYRAIKITLSHSPDVKHSSEVELRMLRHLKQLDPNNIQPIVRCHTFFKYYGHLCIVMDYLEMNLTKYRQSQPQGILSLHSIRIIAKQLLGGLEFLHRHQIIHGDIKPENILVSPSEGLKTKIADFGNANFTGYITSNRYCQTRFYRAPEVIMGHSCRSPADMWSLGCVLVEMHLGMPIFEGNNEGHVFCTIMEVIGLPQQNTIATWRKRFTYFTLTRGTFRVRPYMGFKYIQHSISEIVLIGGPTPLNLRRAAFERTYRPRFVDFLRKIFVYQSSKRLSAEQGLRHIFIDADCMCRVS